jgi:hypothetical protein
MYNQRALFFLLLLLILGNSTQGFSQLKISAIDIEGNVKTKAYIMYRELPYHAGDVIPVDSLTHLNTLAQQQLFNTSLFLDVMVIPHEVDSLTVRIQIKVKERWYLFPIPYFRWVDRNFSEWWNVNHRSLDRVNYGLNFRQSNVTGNNDRLTIGLITGYTQQAIVRYSFPYIDKNLKYGLGVGWMNFTQKEINLSTQNDKQVFFKTLDPVQQGYRANASIFYRPSLFERHVLQVGIGNNQIADTAFSLQNKYFPNFKKSFSYADLTLSFSKVKFNYNAYPTQGASTELALYQRFSDQSNFTSIQFRKVLAHSFSANNFLYIESNSIGKFLPNPNYSDLKLMGYGNMQMSGLEYYIIDGNAATMLKGELHHALGTYIAKSYFYKKYIPEIKYQFWIKVFSNLGYVYSEHPMNASRLSNTLLRTAGVGLDVTGIYDFVLKIDYSVNQLGDKGVYLHGGINF